MGRVRETHFFELRLAPVRLAARTDGWEADLHSAADPDPPHSRNSLILKDVPTALDQTANSRPKTLPLTSYAMLQLTLIDVVGVSSFASDDTMVRLG